MSDAYTILNDMKQRECVNTDSRLGLLAYLGAVMAEVGFTREPGSFLTNAGAHYTHTRDPALKVTIAYNPPEFIFYRITVSYGDKDSFQLFRGTDPQLYVGNNALQLIRAVYDWAKKTEGT